MKERLWARYPVDAFNLVRCVRAFFLSLTKQNKRQEVCDVWGRTAPTLTCMHTRQNTNSSKGFDPKGVLSNTTISALFDDPPQSAEVKATA